ncbi:DNA mismatch repair protein [Fictibacillus macauensis ZFHKF-1]|uniref:DNA mismatch repair protein MutL n=1 Tax=Fictibacillus macauensis ZFHKF-1 TaxID=1196324 RepID=I8ALU1_9BACL|nr:DNA mismatch repair endonuclease MutL [Fictibacillus macauensis]EIT86897.1 DNA mismatch repair protein [Fictibacillus macauensis ZFHKF-1]
MGQIIQLDDHLSNKIAAGEVVERPASVVKELVENAIDAKSTRIEIELEEGGLSSIRILDNGSGIEPEDCELAFSRHATSKIKDEQDLFQIRTMGFRGEALPSIASVSHVDMKTGTGNGPGTAMKIVNGRVQQLERANARKGTEITVSALFYNTPARLKHMKTIHTELGNISDVVNRLALGHPHISFRLKHNGKEMLHTNGNGNLLQVIAAVYGMSTAKQMVAVSGQSLDYSIEGFVVKPEVTRASRNYMSFFMNGRYIKNYAVQKALVQAYHTLLPIGRYPIAVLSITMDPSIIDVNVHPSKLEARLSKEPELTALVEDAVKQVLRQLKLIPEPLKQEKRESLYSEQAALSLEHSFQAADIADRPKEDDHQVFLLRSEPSYTTIVSEEIETVKEERAQEVVCEEPENEVSSEVMMHEPAQQEHRMEPATTQKVPVLYPVGQVHGTYIIAQNDQGMYLIDQHAAQERIKYEYFREKVGDIASEVQDLLVPMTFEVTHKEWLILEEHQALLQQVGVFLEHFGTHSYIVRSHPQWFPKGYEQETIEEIIAQVLQEKRTDIKKLREKSAIMMSCKGSIKANHHLTEDGMFTLLETLRRSEDPFTCPHGRPIIVHFSTYELQKMFKRVM